MSFYDDPIVDDNSKRSEESVNVVVSLFTRKNGFITRPDNTDYGVDLEAELITSGVGASSQKFPIQIKSAIQVKKVQINEEEFISLTFKTSRLGYLAKRQPAYGIVALYDDTEQICYFDYVDDIITRLDNNPARDGWREQEHVNIPLPVQVLNTAALPALHERFLTRFKNSHLMVQEHGPNFNIPSLGPKAEQPELKIDFKDPVQVADFLEKFGSLLYNKAEFATLNQLLGVISRERLNNSPQLIFLAAITYTQTGHIIDAEYYIRKARKTPEVMKGEGTGMIEFSAARLEFLKGNIDYAYFLKTFKEVAENAETLENKLTLKINILFFELLKGMETDDFPSNYEDQVASLHKEIDAANIVEYKKHLLRCHHADSQFHFAHRGEINLYGEVKLKDELNNPMPMAERASRVMRYINLINEADKAVYEAYLFGRDNELPLLQATAAHQMGQHFFARRSSLLMLREQDKMPQDKAKLVEMFERNQNYSLIAYGLFLKLNTFQNAHEALGIAYEINQLCIHLTQTPVGEKTPDELMVILKQIEETFDLLPFESGMTRMIETLRKRANHDGKHFRDKSDEELEDMASKILNGYNLPADRLPNLVHDMHMLRKFEQSVTNSDVSMLQDLRHTQRASTHYASLPLYILRHQKLGIETKPSSDINWLLGQFSTILKKNND
jgi:hypothetical protein